MNLILNRLTNIINICRLLADKTDGDILILKRKGEWLEITVPSEWNGLTIEYVLKDIWHVSKGMLQKLSKANKIKVNGKLTPWVKELKIGEKFQVHIFYEEDYGVMPVYSEIDILYEDDFLLAVNKRADIEIHPTDMGQTDTLANYVAYYYLSNGIKTKVRHIHRLDKDTTGVIIYAKNALTSVLLDRLLAIKLIKRTYIAVVQGLIKENSGVIVQPIGRDRHHPTKRIVSKTGKDAITLYEVIKYYPKEDQTLVKLELQTGRTHQIRVHMSYIGHPIIGDKLYGHAGNINSGQALHAFKTTFVHPFTNEEITCIAPFISNPPIFNNKITEYIRK